MTDFEWLAWTIADEMVSAYQECWAAAFDRLMAEESELEETALPAMTRAAGA